MKKWLIGCLVTGLLLVVVVCGAAYWFVWRPLSEAAGGDIMGQVDDLKKLGEAEQAIKNKSSYTAPADGKLSPAQVSAFIAIQQTISDKMGNDFALMEEKYKKMDQMDNNSDPSLKDVMGGVADLTKLMAKAKQAQVEGLNVQNMSMDEYHWIRDQVSAALPYLSVDVPFPAPVAGNEPEVSSEPSHENNKAEAGDAESAAVDEAVAKAKAEAEEALKQNIPGGQQVQDIMNGPDSEAVRANVELLRPHKELLLKTLTAAWMGL
ncbi:MAG: hypothetical protein ACREO1_12340 [Arenimonas sp.]